MIVEASYPAMNHTASLGQWNSPEPMRTTTYTMHGGSSRRPSTKRHHDMHG